MRVVRAIVFVFDIVSFCFWGLVVIGLGDTDQFLWGHVWFNVIAWGLPVFCFLITCLVLPRK